MAKVVNVLSGGPPVWQVGDEPDISNAILSVAFSPDGRYLSTSSEDGITRIWEWDGERTSKKPFSYVTNTRGVRNSVFSHDGEFIATACWDGTIRVWKCGEERNFEVGRAVQDEVMDNTFPRHPFERYADDIVIHCNSKREAELLLERLKNDYRSLG